MNMKNYDKIIKNDLIKNKKKYIGIIISMFVFFLFTVILMIVGMKHFGGKYENTKKIEFRDEVKSSNTFLIYYKLS